MLDGQEYYRISGYHRMAPFLMSLASESDLWMSVTSRGGLTAGRVDADHSLFPYLTVDQLHDAHHHTGPVTLIRIDGQNEDELPWKPFAELTNEDPEIERNLYKNAIGNRLVFEEVNHELGLAFRYGWSACDEFGWVRTSVLENRRIAAVEVSIMDGLRNVLPHGAPLHLYQQASNLVDAYKKSEVDPASGLGIFSLTAGITDRAEALEVLRANTVWCCGLDDFKVHLSLESLADFRGGRSASGEKILNGVRGNYLVSSRLSVEPGHSSKWHMTADAGRDHIQIGELRRRLIDNPKINLRIEDALLDADDKLLRNVGSADGIQLSGHKESANHHFANVLFNNMRGGVPQRNYELPVKDFTSFLEAMNSKVASRNEELLNQLPERISVGDLLEAAQNSQDTEFERVCHEYLPFHFGRRHGDPSRPWNRFSIRALNELGERELHYEGNWRDIFQNWEALLTAFPGFLPSIIAKFVNASTVDGFNPYRISREGLDWETITPEDPWSNIGYWGDHQIIYLLKLLESAHKHDPAMLDSLLSREIFSYAEIPYIIKSYEEILQNPTSTIEFDYEKAARIDIRVGEKGMDGKLLENSDGSVYHVNLFEKLLVPILSKLSNLIPDAGIWMNTQRPEWNDANNALGGGGVSAVTLYHLRRHLSFIAELFEKSPQGKLPLSAEVAKWFEGISSIFERESGLIESKHLDNKERKRLMDALGEAFSKYRETVYAHGLGGKTEITLDSAALFCRNALKFVEWGIRANRREGGLYHSYNLLEFSDDGSEVEVRHLEEMLEGQVAYLSSGISTPEEALQIVKDLYASALYRPDQQSFILYPERVLPGFLAKNMVPEEAALSIPLLKDMLESGDKTLIAIDPEGVHRFNASFRNARDLSAALDQLGRLNKWTDAVTQDRGAVLELYENVFKHRSYLGRSGVMYAYEGLGCIYWHMVAKLQLALQEAILQAEDNCDVLGELKAMYFKIRSGFGYEKSVSEYGAFPTDPYSHTPPGGGAKQPGMTGHVKEAILNRMGELGLKVDAGVVHFNPALLQESDFLSDAMEFRFYDVAGELQSRSLDPDSMAFTYCQVPVIYKRVDGEASIQVSLKDGSSSKRNCNRLDAELSSELFSRSGLITEICVEVPLS